MDSHEVMRQAADRVGAKKVAADLKVSPSLVYKWCQPRPENASAEGEGSGAWNPLDRVAGLLGSTGDVGLVEWLCRRAGGSFVADPAPKGERLDATFIANTQRIIEDFSRLLEAVSRAIADDGQVDAGESARIRDEWQRLKQYGETFVRGCERGLFAHRPA